MPREGVFARVLKGGEIHVGDEVTLLPPPEDPPLRAAVITLSDKGSRGEREDKSGPLIVEMLTAAGYVVEETMLLPDEAKALKAQLIRLADGRQVNLILTTGGKVGVYMIPEGGTLATALASNKKYTASATGELTYDSEDQAIYFPVDGSKVNFVTYYPYTATVSNNQIAVDVTNQTSQEAIDLLYATTTTGFNNASTKVNLNFTHQLTRMVLNITKASNVTLTNFSVKLVGTETKAAFDLATGTLTTTAGNVASIAYKLTDKGNDQYQAEAIVLPSSKLADDVVIEFTHGGLLRSRFNVNKQ
jgi:hypothetical protein